MPDPGACCEAIQNNSAPIGNVQIYCGSGPQQTAAPTVSFTADEMDEGSFRETFGRLGASELKIIRSPGINPKLLSKIQKAIVSILADDKPHWKRDIVKAASDKGFSYTGINKALVRLTSIGEIVCFEHGLYGSSRTSGDAAAEFPPRKNQLRDKTSSRK